MTFRLAALAAMLGLVPAAAFAVFPDFGGLDPSTGAYRYMLYDTDGVAGAREMSATWYNSGTRDWIWPDGTVFAHSDTIGSSTGSTLPAEWIGDPYWIRLESPAFGCVVFSDVIGAMYRGPLPYQFRPVFVIPVSFSENSLPQTLKRCLGVEEPTNFQLAVAAFLVDQRDSPTTGLTVKCRPDRSSVSSSILVEYLPGNALESVGMDLVVTPIVNGGQSDSMAILSWGGTQSWYLRPEIPFGPIRLTVSVPDYEPDVYEFQVTGPECGELRCILVPAAEPIPAHLPQGLEPNVDMVQPMQASTIVSTVLPPYLEGCTLAGGIESRAVDSNQDGLSDVADMIRGVGPTP